MKYDLGTEALNAEHDVSKDVFSRFVSLRCKWEVPLQAGEGESPESPHVCRLPNREGMFCLFCLLCLPAFLPAFLALFCPVPMEPSRTRGTRGTRGIKDREEEEEGQNSKQSKLAMLLPKTCL